MQPDQPDKGAGAPNQSLLFQSLKVYLDNKTRQQPIIGLDSVTECVKAGSCNQETLYLCVVCQCRIKRADVRNHIMGTLHRYRYIKARHPDLARGWGQAVDIPKLARPLMELASELEKRDGPGIVQVVELDAIDFQAMGQKSAATAICRLNAVRREQMQKKTPPCQTEGTQTHLASSAVQSQRVELSQTNCPVQTQNAATVQRQTSSVQLERIKVEPDEGVSEADATPNLLIEKSAEPCVKSESSDTILDGYAVIGLHCVVECRRKEDGRSSCFLCHCCRVKSDPGDIIDHLTSSTHISNYLMEAYPECVDAMMGGLSVEKELLQSLARRVEEVEERKEQKVLEWPAHLCDQLSDKTYHWCVKMLSDSENGTSAERQKKSGFKGLEAFHPTETRKGGIEVGSERAAKKRRNETQPVFKVSIPLTQGAFVLERSSFSRSNSPAVGTSPGPPPETLAPDSDLEFGPQTVTAFEPPRLPRTIEVRCTDSEANIPVVIGHRQEEHICDWGLPSQESGADAYTAIPSHHSCYPDPPYPEYIADVQTHLIQGDPMPPHAAGHPAGGTGFPGSSFDVAPETLTSWVGPDLHDQDSANSDAQQKPAVIFYFCTPNGQRQP